MNSTVRVRLLGSSALVGAAFISAGGATSAFAAELDTPIAATTAAAVSLAEGGGLQTVAPVASGPVAAPQEVVVTGSRIRSPGLTSTSPLAVVGSQELTDTGAIDVTTVLQELPQSAPGENSGLSNLSNGTATVNLRGLGSVRTLVLVDGKRLMPGDPSSPAADLNNIPSPLVDRIEVITGGASSVYGSDAVAGVVNFIMKKDFQGVRIEATDDFSNHTNDNTAARSVVSGSGFTNAPGGNQTNNLGEQVTAVIGMNAPDNKGNITAYASYRHLEPILESKYDVSACTISATASDAAHYAAGLYNAHTCGGSSNGLYGQFKPTAQSKSFGGSTVTLHDATDGSQAFVTTGVPKYNYGATNYFQRSETRYTAGYFAHYDINKSLEIYSDFMFADDQTVGQIAPSGLFAGTGANGGSTFAINCNNPLLTAAQQGQLCGTAAGTPQQVNYQIGYRFGSFPRDYGYQHTNYKIDVGAKGDLADGWSYDAYLQYGTSLLQDKTLNDVSANNIQNALLVNPATGLCYSGGSCVPLNIFKAGGVTPQAFNYVSVPAEIQGSTTEQIASASITGDLGHYGVKSPFAEDGVGVAFGTEYRRENLVYTPDETYQQALLSGTGRQLPNAGTYDVYELFGEARVPLVQNRPFVKNLSLDLGYRFSDYSTAGVTDTYKAQFDYSPTADVRFRGGYNRAVRAPNIVELFKPQVVGLGGASDPCIGATPTASLAACVASGLPAAEYGHFDNSNACPAGQCGVLTGGSATLKPEIADTYTLGVVLTPTWSWARGFTLSLDYFNIQVSNVITVVPAAVTAQQCGEDIISACQLITRDPATGIIYGQNGYVSELNINSGNIHTDGIDMEANYRKRFVDLGLPDIGGLALNLVSTWTEKFTTKIVNGGSSYDCAGLYGFTCGNPNPHWKAKFRATYTPNALPISVTAAVRYVGTVKLDGNSTNPVLAHHPYGLTDTADNSLHPYTYLDLAFTWHVRDSIKLTAGVNNVLDKDPPIVDSGIFVDAGTAAGNGNTYPGVYDTLGRTAFVTLTADF